MIPRGIRNNNPGNIRKSKSPWLGKKPVSTDPDFEQFDHPRYGIRALGLLLRTYQRTYGLDTVRGLITRYAPNTENNTDMYVKRVCELVGVGQFQKVNLNDEMVLLPIMLAIIRHENNNQQPYAPAVINEAMDLIGSP